MNISRRFLLMLIRFYRAAISPWLSARCRFEPTCSAYALEAVALHGAFKGSLLSLRRISRCHPFHRGGFDPVPSRHPGAVSR